VRAWLVTITRSLALDVLLVLFLRHRCGRFPQHGCWDSPEARLFHGLLQSLARTFAAAAWRILQSAVEISGALSHFLDFAVHWLAANLIERDRLARIEATERSEWHWFCIHE
jgi:hypothetical protein